MIRVHWLGGVAVSLSVLAAGCASSGTARTDNGATRTVTRCALDFRWLNNAGFEIVLSNGSHVLVDPWLDSAQFFKFPLAEIERADYLILTHIHYDHAEDVKSIQSKFPGIRIFVGSLSAEPLVKWQKLNAARVYKVSDEQVFQFDDVAIKAYAGRHTESNRGNFLSWDATGEMTPLAWGTLELYQFALTDTDGTKFVVWAGTPSVDNAYKLSGVRPDIAAVHISPKQDFSILARIINSMAAQVVMPHHYDIWPTILRTRPDEVQQFPQEVQPVTPDNVIAKMMPYVSNKLSEGSVKAKYFVPDHHAWYHYDKAMKTVLPGRCNRNG
jgi:L-ascorbate metabolism protein UlaG (beta-lactamase superfamily)